ncbi:ATP-grasp domain-containing protein [Flavisolibacter tropicus]|uniref:Uncharacterized protein n=1 Tax=Flavisolibacter tropicus TaxID=1492898 RepID=A0A172U095_9BACT|nr:ATP-grasp domain-containing protein [Flavisolibacter tropicus]ANE52443.1 hypothetical protein SY85_20110 [Flavisolibacter tropicus]
MGKKVLVTGIGGNVGYGILRNILRYHQNIEIIGTNTERISAGNHLCHVVYEVPFSTNENYIPEIQTICKKHDVDLIIPSTDYESFILASNKEKLTAAVAVSPANTCHIFLDKYITYKTLSGFNLPFAQSILPSEYKDNYEEVIVKPREGRGSRGIHINPSQPKSFSDEYLVQPFFKGKEITTAFYVTKEGLLHGLITLERSLSSGATNMCEVNTDFDERLKAYIVELISKIEIRGACNLQSIIVGDDFIPFEVNCRISGTNSIRSQFGFKDVSYTLDEYLFNTLPEPVQLKRGAAIRIMHDIIYPEVSLSNINNQSDNFYIYE